jgi:hypothetical protein
MSKKKGLGRDVNNSIEAMDALLGTLKEFHKIPLKRGLQSTKFEDEKGDKVAKAINETMEKAFNLTIMVEDLRNLVSGIKEPKGNSRFASHRIIAKFLDIE